MVVRILLLLTIGPILNIVVIILSVAIPCIPLIRNASLGVAIVVDAVMCLNTGVILLIMIVVWFSCYPYCCCYYMMMCYDCVLPVLLRIMMILLRVIVRLLLSYYYDYVHCYTAYYFHSS